MFVYIQLSNDIHDEIPSYGSGLPYTTNTIGPNNDSVMVNQPSPSLQDEVINPITHPELEVFECIKCSHPNVLKKTPRRRRQTRVRHFRIDDVVYASLKRFASINNVDLNYGILLLLLHAKTQNIDYVISPNSLAIPRGIRGKNKNKKKRKE